MKAILHIKEKGPGRGWWGPPKGTHVGRKKHQKVQNPRALEYAQECGKKELRRVSRRMGLSEEEVVQRVNSTMESAGRDYPVAIRVPVEVLPQIFEEGRLKNQHETTKSKGNYNPAGRKKAEQTAFMIEGDNPSDYPIYGFMDIPGSDTNWYGGAKIVLKPDIRSRTTMTAGDSLMGFMNMHQTGTSLSSPGMEAWGDCTEALSIANGRAKNAVRKISYFESQIHGGVKLSDIDYIEIDPLMLPNMSDYYTLRTQGRKLGISIFEGGPQ